MSGKMTSSLDHSDVFMSLPGTHATPIAPVRHQICIPDTQAHLSSNASPLFLSCGLHSLLHFPQASDIASIPCPHHTVAFYKYWHFLAVSHKPLLFPACLFLNPSQGQNLYHRTVDQPAIPVTCISSRCTYFVTSRPLPRGFL